jgi:hypothetical protein
VQNVRDMVREKTYRSTPARGPRRAAGQSQPVPAGMGRTTSGTGCPRRRSALSTTHAWWRWPAGSAANTASPAGYTSATSSATGAGGSPTMEPCSPAPPASRSPATATAERRSRPPGPRPRQAAERRGRHVESRMRGNTARPVAGVRLHSAGGHGKRTRGNPGTAPVADLTGTRGSGGGVCRAHRGRGSRSCSW